MNLYTSDHDSNIEDIHKLLRAIDLAHLTQDQVRMLDKPIALEELFCTLNQIPNKAPGPDGFPAGFYKHFWPTLFPLFIRMTDKCMITSRIPPTMNTAMITLLLKPNKDLTQSTSYTPLSLVNKDITNTSKVLASCFEKVIPALIHPDQAGLYDSMQKKHLTKSTGNSCLQYLRNLDSENHLSIG